MPISTRLIPLHLTIFSLLASPARAMSLAELFREAQKSTESLAISVLEVDRLKELTQQSESQAGQRLQLQSSIEASSRWTNGTQTKGLQPSLQAEWRHPLYNGGLIAAQIRGAQAMEKSAQWRVASNREELYLECVQVFYDLEAARQDIKILAASIDNAKERLELLEARAKIGRSRETEVLAARTQVEVLYSQVLASQVLEQSLEARIAVLSGQRSPISLEDDLRIEDLFKASIQSVPAVEVPALVSAQARIQAAEEKISEKAALQMPMIDGFAAYRRTYPNEQSLQRLGFGLGLNWILYDAGERRSGQRAAFLEKQAATLQLQRLQRLEDLERQLANTQFHQELERVKNLQKASELAQKNVLLQRQEYQQGLIGQIEWTQAIDTELQVTRSLTQSMLRAKAHYRRAKLRSERQFAT